MIVIELFSGTGTISQAFRDSGHKTMTFDNDQRFNADSQINIFNFKKSDLPKEFQTPDVIWASPPCTAFSTMSMGHYWTTNGRPKIADTYLGIALALKTMEIIRELKPKYWFVENPRGMMRKMHFMTGLIRRTVTYCQYGEEYQKPTDIWTNNTNWKPRMMCEPGASCHVSAKRGSNKGVQELEDAARRGRIPPELCKEIVESCGGGPY